MNDTQLDGTVDAFMRRAVEARSLVHEMRDWGEVAVLALGLAGDGRVAVSRPAAEAGPALIDALGGRVLAPGQVHGVTASASVGVVRGALGIAETGSVLLVEERAEDRAVSMLSPVVIQVLHRDEVVSRLEALLERVLLAPGGPPVFASLTTGPSRTADIERALTIGVHGPREVHVVVLG
ncbi:MAG: LUD domain-containing protein [Dehalococcoidia bacterium]